MKTLYDISFEEDGTISVEQVTVLEESIMEGAITPTYLVQYADGSKARCSKDMYHESLEAALVAAQEDLADNAQNLEEQRTALKTAEATHKKWKTSLDKLNCEQLGMTTTDFYIVYNKQTKEVKGTFKAFGPAIEAYLKRGNGTLAWINRTHPKHKDLLKELIF